jgi:hypothetical protein
LDIRPLRLKSQPVSLEVVHSLYIAKPVVMVNELPRRWRFAGIPNITFNYAARCERDPMYKAATLPGLGLIETFDGLEGFALSIDKQASNCKPWERFTSYVHYLNQEGPGSYKVLYITRHGRGFHNAFKAQVGSEAWEVGFPVRSAAALT